MLAQLSFALDPKPSTEAALMTAFALIVGQYKPARFHPPGDIITEMEKGWGKLCVALAESGCHNPEKLTVFDLYTWLESFEEKYEAQKAALKPQANATKR